MSFDELMHEVNEDLRKENLLKFWQKYGNALISGALVIVAAAALYSGFKSYQVKNRAADAFTLTMATAQIQDGKKTEALATLDDLMAKGNATVPDFARFQKAAILAENGKKDEAMALYDALIQNTKITDGLRHTALLLKASLMVDTQSPEEVEGALKPLMNMDTYGAFARELYGLSLLKANQKEAAKKVFEEVLSNDKAPHGLRARISILIEACA